MDDVKSIKKIIELIEKYSEENNINENTEIITSNIIDSFAIIQIIFDLENIFQIKIEAEELNIENFKNAISIYEFIKKIPKND